MNVENCNHLELEQACVFLNTNYQDENATLYSLSSDCMLCPYKRISKIVDGKNTSIKFNTAIATSWRVYINDSEIKDFRSATDENGMICQFQPNIGEYGLYELSVDYEKGCKFLTIKEPSNPYIPLAIIFGAIACFLIIFSLLRSCINLARRKWSKSQRQDESISNNNNVGDEAKSKRRVLSIDTFRGLSILMMIFVNNGAGGYAILEHATWNGLLVGDLVFPCFVWIMGVCIPISLSSQLAHGISRFSIAKGIVKRSILLFLIGVALNTVVTGSSIEKIRIFGVLQRFGVAYLIVALLYTFLSRRSEKRIESPRLRRISDFIYLLPQWIVILIITGVHCGLTFCLPVPGCPTGYLGPGGRHSDGKFFNCAGGASGYLDRTLLGKQHLYQHPTIDEVYGSGPFDPEGILGCLTTVLQTFLGVQTGKIIKVHKSWKSRIVRWLIFAIICAAISVGLDSTDIIPVNKNLWSLSFVFLTTAFALAALTVLYLFVDVMAIWRGGPFRVPGMNALVMYIGHQMCYQLFPFHWSYGEMSSHMWLTISAVWDVAAWTIIAYILHRKKIYITL